MTRKLKRSLMQTCKWCGAVAVVVDSYGNQCAVCWLQGKSHGKGKQATSDTKQGSVRERVRQNIQEGQEK